MLDATAKFLNAGGQALKFIQMLELIASNQHLDIGNVSFTITLNNPMFAITGYEGSYVFNFEIPATIRNRSILNVIDPLQSVSNDYQEIPFSIIYNGITLVDEALLSVKSVVENLITVNVKVGTGQFNYLMKDQNLHELDLGTMEFSDANEALTYFNDNVDKFYPETPFALPMVNSVADSYLPEDQLGFHYKDIFNVFDGPDQTYVPLNNTDKGIIVPMLFNRFILEKICSLLNYTIDDQFFATDPDFSKLVLFNHFNINGGIPAIEGEPGYYSNISYISYNNHVPQIKVLEYILGLQNLLCVGFFFDHSKKHLVIKDLNALINSTDLVDFSDNILNSKSVGDTSYNGYKMLCEPDDNDDFYAEKVTLEDKFLDHYGGSLDLISDLPDRFLGHWFYYVQEDGNFYKWNIFPFPGAFEIDATFVDKLYSLFISGKQELEITTPFSTIAIDPVYGNDFMTFSIAASKFREFAPRLVFYKGLVNGIPWDLPRCHNELPDASLLWSDTNGLVNKRWSNFLAWRCGPNKTVKFQKLMEPVTFQNLDLSKKYRILGENYFIKQVKLPFINGVIQPAKIECFKV